MIKFKNDKFRKKRDGWSRFLDLSCSKCKTHLCYYQKDGSGILKRIYLDRIIGTKISKSNFTCSKCKETIGVPIIYKKEKRPAMQLFEGSVAKKIIPNQLIT